MITVEEAFQFLIDHPDYRPYMVLIDGDSDNPIVRLCGFEAPSIGEIFSLSCIKQCFAGTLKVGG